MTNIKMHDDELDIEVTLVQQLLDAQFPQWSMLSINRVASSGTDNAIFQIGTDLCARLPRIESAARNIEKEHVWLPKIAPRLPIAISLPMAKGFPDIKHLELCRQRTGLAFNRTNNLSDTLIMQKFRHVYRDGIKSLAAQLHKKGSTIITFRPLIFLGQSSLIDRDIGMGKKDDCRSEEIFQGAT